MRRLLIVVLIIISLSCSSTLGGVTVEKTQPPAVVAAGTSGLTRVYGVDYSADIFASCRHDTYRGYVQGLSEIGSRFTRDTANNLAARNWISDQLITLSNDRIEVEIVGSHNNVVGVLPGYLPGDHPVFVISAHYDTQEGSPGANDDASGIATVLELARVFSEYEWPLDIYFVAFNDAVPPLMGLPFQGSDELAAIWESEGLDIYALYNVDTILYPYRYASPTERVLLGYADLPEYQTSQYWAELVKMVGSVNGYDVVGLRDSASFPIWTQSDHISFYQEGYRSVVCAHESGYFVDGVAGTSEDLYDFHRYDYYLARTFTSQIGAAIAFSMSRAYGESTHVYPTGLLMSGSSRTYRIAITTPTTIDVFTRWFGGGAEYRIYSPNDILIDSVLFNNASAWEPIQVLSTNVTSPGLYSVVIGNLAVDSLGYEMEIVYDTDIDANHVLDRNEYWLDTALFHADDDEDDLSNGLEIVLGTDVNSADSDSDTVPDSWEYEHDFDPLDPGDASEDADDDGLSNLNEYLNGLDPWNPDSDSDKLPDLWEVENGLNPLLDDADLDLDGDGLTNWEEYEAGSNPQMGEQETLSPLFIYVPSGVFIIVLLGAFVYRRYSSLIT